ncbi:MAG: type II toxin-antitoxin system prevent-host-death family antitoxin [Brevundimonas sp.]|uniref:type II toxin-antitoxin system Phd/YefM family antitoxin n=1 Tax=Brevundimonas sp. TaxID=1871086 RepID=UPI0025C13A48|nr:type II toxin-antitoxin system prevent-host-death family antitoxin [Brevundimonas sp.]MBX3478661.1 type II toxin-antitoxin system prevent-host-death family antitoxin [Brevundimonas sp.]
MAVYGVAEAKNNFTHLLDRVEKGESITITRHGRPVAELKAAPRLTLEERRAKMEEFIRRRDLRPHTDISAAALVRAMRDGDPE